MMSKRRKQERVLDRWLRYERSGEEARAEKALGQLMRALPKPEVPVGFADRVLAGSGIRFRAARRRLRVPGWAWQSAFGIWLVSSFVVATGATGFVVALGRSGQAVALTTRLLVALGRFGADVMTVIGGLLRAGSAVSSALSGPGVLTLVLACGLASLAALSVLKPLLASERSRHVESY